MRENERKRALDARLRSVMVVDVCDGEDGKNKRKPQELVWAQRWRSMCAIAKMKARSGWWQQRTVKMRENERKRALDARLHSAVDVCSGEDGENERKPSPNELVWA